MEVEWNECLFLSLGNTPMVFEPKDVEFALSHTVDMARVYKRIQDGECVGKGSVHMCVADASYAFRVRRAPRLYEYKDAALRNDMICELRYAQLAYEAGVGLACPFFGVVRFRERDERLLSCWPLGAPLVEPFDATLRPTLRAALEKLATRLVALDACKPANWVTVGSSIHAIDFETHLCFQTITESQRSAAAGFVPVLLALFEMCTELRFPTGVAGGESHTVESLAETIHAAMCSLLDAYSGQYESFANVRFGIADVSYALIGVLVKYTEFCIFDFEEGKKTVRFLRRMRAALEVTAHVHHTYAEGVVSDTRAVRELILPFATLMASLVDGAERRPTRGGAVSLFYKSVSAVWRPNERSKKRRFECVD